MLLAAAKAENGRYLDSPDDLPVACDPFAGGGSTPLEA